MNLLVVIAVWASIGASSLTAAETTMEEYDLEVYSESERIIGGSDAEAGQFPYAASLHDSDSDRFLCTASIISPTTVMTAAHCVVTNDTVRPEDSFYLIANVSHVAQSPRIAVARVIPHPEYDKNESNNDIAILKTFDLIEFSDEVGAVCIARPDTEEMQYKSATAIGWGTNSTSGNMDVDTLQHVEQKIVNCSASDDNEDTLCATGSSKAVCFGDSGGPLVHLSADQPPVEIGIASYTTDGLCAEDPAVFTRVSSYYDFIMKEAQDDSICSV